MLNLRDYQEEAVEAVVTEARRGVRRQLVVLPTGAGKTILAAALSQQAHGRVLMLVHRDELVQQSVEKFGYIWPEQHIGVVKAERDEHDRHVVVASVQTLQHKRRRDRLNKDEFSLVIVDECFPTGTLVDGVPIEHLQVGDLVTAYDPDADVFVKRQVTHLFRRPVQALVRVTAGSRRVVCTPNHPFWTGRGWVAARQLRSGDHVLAVEEGDNGASRTLSVPEMRTTAQAVVARSVMSSLSRFGGAADQRSVGALRRLRNSGTGIDKARQGRVPPVGQGLLLGSLQAGGQTSYFLGDDDAYEQTICLGPHAEAQPDGQWERATAYAPDVESDGLEATRAGRQRPTLAGAAAHAGRGLGMGDRSGGADEDAQRIGISDLLQDGHRRSQTENCDRGGREFPPVAQDQAEGRQEGVLSRWTRVDGVEVLEPGSDGTFGGLCPGGVVYNLEVDGPHTYVAGGLVVHNCHHAVSPSYREILEDLSLLPDTTPGRLLLGITATPMRGDGIGLKGVFEKIVYRRSISDLVRAGYLADVKGIRVRTAVDLGKVRTVRGDFQAKDLSLAVDTPRRNELIVDAYRKHGERRKAVAFSVDIAHAQHLAEAFREGGFRADWVSGELPIEERRERLRRLRDGEMDVLANCAVLTEGWDEPSVACLIMARPTKSTGLYIQMAGRGLRPYPGKDYCLVIDVSDNAHDICALGTLDGDDADFTKGRDTDGLDGPAGGAGEKEEPGEIGEGVQIVVSTMDLLARSKFRWRIERRQMVLEAGPGREIMLEQVDADLWSVTLRQGRDLQPLTERPLPISYAQGVAEDYVRANQLESYAARDAAWLKKPASEAQMDLLKREFNIVPPQGTTRGEAQEIIRRAFRDRSLNDPNAPWRQDPASEKQLAWMEAHGYVVPPGFTKGDFSDLMEKLKSRGRRRA